METHTNSNLIMSYLGYSSTISTSDVTKTIRSDNDLQVHDLVLSPSTREAFRGKRSLALTPGEFDLLAFLMRNVGKTLSSARIVNSIWGSDYLPSSSVVEMRVCALRKKLCANGEPNMIFTVRGFGYVLR